MYRKTGNPKIFPILHWHCNIIMYFETNGLMPLLLDHALKVFTSLIVRLVWHEIYQFLTEICCIIIIKHWKKKRNSFESIALKSCPCQSIWLPISICLELSASFAMLGSLTSYVSDQVLLMRGYSTKCKYSMPNFFILLLYDSAPFQISWYMY